MGLKILIVSNVDALVTAISKTLEKKLCSIKFEILTAFAISEAKTQLNSQKFDLLLTDNQFKISGSNGLEFAIEAKAMFPELKIMIMSNVLSPQDVPPGIWLLQKPWGFDSRNELIENITEMFKDAQQ